MAQARSANDGRRRTEAIARQLANWATRADFVGDPDRRLPMLLRNPDKYIDPELSASANWERVKSELGLITQSERDKRMRDADDAQADRARAAIRDQADAIEAGDAEQLVADITAEYGRGFVEAELARARTDRQGIEADVASDAGAPEPNEHNPSAVAPGTRADIETAEPAPTAEPVEARVSAEPVEPEPATPAPENTGENTRPYAARAADAVAGAARWAVLRAAPRGRLTGPVVGSLLGAWRLAAAEYRAGLADGAGALTPPREQSTLEAYQ